MTSIARCFVTCCSASWTASPPPPRWLLGIEAFVRLTTRPPHMT